MVASSQDLSDVPLERANKTVKCRSGVVGIIT